MGQCYYEGWDLFEKKSLELIKKLKIKGIEKSEMLKILEIPSLSWTCVKRWELYEGLIVRIDWFCQEDIKRFREDNEEIEHQNQMYPTIKYKIKKVDKSFSQSSIQELSNISIPICTKRESVGCDGTNYELEVGSYWEEITIKWWEEGPSKWKAIDDFTKKLIGEFDSLLNDEEYINDINFCGKLWLQPRSSVKITKDLMKFLKQFSRFECLNVVEILKIFREEQNVILEYKFDYVNYKSIRSEFDKYGLNIDFLI